ncbi:hypothetical protein [Nocardia sp. CDC160]|uniref:hypothetical protein n=1 Tax=Nocardia sp. CDC160 TaxID=3112166 RepID=UPI002DB922D2|nr:hypothetical protein [Nocardia sp. CDC160]MEC3915978.1 hypothetical protein [Nocardia sp. CDC160]
MPDHRRAQLHIVSTSNAADRGFLALADLAAAAEGLPEASYRVIGGHMVQMLQHIYPLDGWRLRGTADADAGMDKEALVAAERQLHEQMVALGYELESGNRYTRASDKGRLDVDILVATFGSAAQSEIVGRAFDSAPGLHLAVAGDVVIANARVDLFVGGTIEFTVPVPDVESAVVLKALAWRKRLADKDVVDLATLFEVVHQHRSEIRTWRLADPSLIGARRDAVAALAMLVSNIDQGRWRSAFTGSANYARFTAIIRRNVGI